MASLPQNTASTSGWACKERLHDVVGLAAVEVGALLRHHLQVREAVHHAVEALGPIPRVVVADQAQDLDVGPLLADLLDEVLAQGDAARVAVRQDLGRGGVGRVDLAVDAEHGDVARPWPCARWRWSRRSRWD